MTAARHAVVIGGGPAGLAAAEVLSGAGWAVDVYEAMPGAGRKFLLAGRGGLNLTHSEPFERFVARYGQGDSAVAGAAGLLRAALDTFTPEDLRSWVAGLGLETFIGSSGRVFPTGLKAAPMLRAWLNRLHAQGVHLHTRHRWLGWVEGGAHRFATPDGERFVASGPTVLALGGASWSRMGSDGAWVPLLESAGAAVAPLRPANCGFDRTGGWSEHLRQRHAGQPVKPVRLSFDGRSLQGEFVLTDSGIEGSLVYAFSAALRDAIERDGQATLQLDLLPQTAPERVGEQLARGQGSKSLTSFLKSQFKLSDLKLALLYEVLGPRPATPALADALKALPLTLNATRPLEEAISTAGGLSFAALDERWQLRSRPGTFVAGEMLDWEAPTGGYLLTACIASGRAAARGAMAG